MVWNPGIGPLESGGRWFGNGAHSSWLNTDNERHSREDCQGKSHQDDSSHGFSWPPGPA